MGRFSYAQNIYHAWSEVHVDTNELTVVSKGVDQKTTRVHDLFSITIRNDQMTDEFIQ